MVIKKIVNQVVEAGGAPFSCHVSKTFLRVLSFFNWPKDSHRGREGRSYTTEGWFPVVPSCRFGPRGCAVLCKGRIFGEHPNSLSKTRGDGSLRGRHGCRGSRETGVQRNGTGWERGPGPRSGWDPGFVKGKGRRREGSVWGPGARRRGGGGVRTRGPLSLGLVGRPGTVPVGRETGAGGSQARAPGRSVRPSRRREWGGSRAAGQSGSGPPPTRPLPPWPPAPGDDNYYITLCALKRLCDSCIRGPDHELRAWSLWGTATGTSSRWRRTAELEGVMVDEARRLSFNGRYRRRRGFATPRRRRARGGRGPRAAGRLAEAKVEVSSRALPPPSAPGGGGLYCARDGLPPTALPRAPGGNPLPVPRERARDAYA